MQGGGRNAVIGGKPVILGGDVIIGVDGVPVTGGDDIIHLLGPKDIGDTVTFTIIRENTTHDLSLVIGEKQR
jgi:S1-C subfamily serine protease